MSSIASDYASFGTVPRAIASVFGDLGVLDHQARSLPLAVLFQLSAHKKKSQRIGNALAQPNKETIA
jgi:hypothetical protein